jgi:hypothetical protein
METTQEPLHHDNWSLVQQNIIEIPTRINWIIVLFDEASKYGESVKFWGSVGTNAKPPSVQFCNSVQYNSFVNYLVCC